MKKIFLGWSLLVFAYIGLSSTKAEACNGSQLCGDLLCPKYSETYNAVRDQLRDQLIDELDRIKSNPQDSNLAFERVVELLRLNPALIFSISENTDLESLMNFVAEIAVGINPLDFSKRPSEGLFRDFFKLLKRLEREKIRDLLSSDFKGSQSHIVWEKLLKLLGRNSDLLEDADFMSRLVEIRDRGGATVLHYAAAIWKVEGVKRLSDPKFGLLEKVLNNGETALHTAARFGKDSTVKFLMDPKLGLLDRFTKTGRTPLHSAAYHGHLSTVTLLTEGAKDTILLHEEAHGFNALHLAVHRGFVKVAEHLYITQPDLIFAKTKSSVGHKNVDLIPKGFTPLDIAKLPNRIEKFRSFIEKVEKDLNKKNQVQPVLPAKPTSLLQGFKMDEKYLGDKVDQYFKKSSSGKNRQRDWVRDPTLSLQTLGAPKLIQRSDPSLCSLPWCLGQNIDGENVPYTRLRFRSLTTKLSELKNERVTFVFVGRGSEGMRPQETIGGRVILVIPKSQEQTALGWMDDQTDLLVIDALEDTQELHLGLISSRRLAAFLLARSTKLHDFVMMDDNLENFYLNSEIFSDVSHPEARTWATAYRLLKAYSKKQEISYLGIRRLRPSYLKPGQKGASKFVNITTNELEDSYDSEERDEDSQEEIEQGLTVKPHKRGRLSSKIFYVNNHKIQEQFKSFALLYELFPRAAVDLPYEDIWLALYLKKLSVTVDVMDRNLLLFSTLRKEKDAAKKSLDRGGKWLQPKLREELLKVSQPNLLSFRTEILDEISNWVLNTVVKRDHTLDKFKETDIAAYHSNDLPLPRFEGPQLPTQQESASMEPRLKKHKDIESSSENRVSKLQAPIQLDDLKRSNAPGGLSDSGELGLTMTESILDHLEGEFSFFRDHQKNALLALSNALAEGKSTGYFEMVTGAGKTNLFLALSLMAQQSRPFVKGRNIMVIQPTRNLVRQTLDEATKLNERMPQGFRLKNILPVYSAEGTAGDHDSVGEVYQKQKVLNYKGLHAHPAVKQGGHFVVICERSFKKYIQEHPEDLFHYSLILVDEIHEISFDLLTQLKSFHDRTGLNLLYGFSATPATRASLWKKIPIFKYTRDEALEKDAVPPWIVDALDWDYSEKQKDELIRLAPEILTHRVHPNGRSLKDLRGLIWVPNIRRAEELQKRLTEAGISSANVNSKVPGSLDTIAKYRDEYSQYKILIAVEMLNIGFDANIDYVIIAKKVSSLSDYLQKIGRIRVDRNNPGKIAYILSIFNGTLPLDPSLNCKLSPAQKKRYRVTPEYLAQFDTSQEKSPYRLHQAKTGRLHKNARRWYQEPEEVMITTEFGGELGSEFNYGFDEKKSSIKKRPLREDDLGLRQEVPDAEEEYRKEIRQISFVKGYDGKLREVKVVPVVGDGDCAFKAMNTRRYVFIGATLDYIKYLKENEAQPTQNGDRFRSLLIQAMESIRAADFNDWLDKMQRRNPENKHAVQEMNEQNLRLYSFLFNTRIHMYILDPENAGHFMAYPTAEVGIIDEVRHPGNAIDIHLAHYPYAPGETGEFVEPNHYDRLEFRQ